MSEIKIKFLDVGWTYSSIKEEIDTAVGRVLQSGNFILGEESELFEQEFAEYVGAEHCVGVASGLDALFLSLKVLGVGPGDEVIVPAHTFIATWLAVTMCGATIIPAEILPLTHNVDPGDVALKITQRTKAIIPVHLYGLPADLERLNQISSDSGVPLIEDAAQSHGAKFDGRTIGAGNASVAWSFYPGKNLGAFGDGGAITTNNSEIATRLRTLRNYGSQEKYVHLERGFNSRLDEIQAAMLRVQLRHLDMWTETRRKLAIRYNDLLRPYVDVPDEGPGERCVFQTYVVSAERRDELKQYLNNHGVEALIHYATPIHLQPAAKELGYTSADFPVTMHHVGRILSLPLYPTMTHTQQDHVAELIESFYARN